MCNEIDHNHDIDWAKQNELHKQWLVDNPDAGYTGWMSI
jgi:hypothetical protein